MNNSQNHKNTFEVSQNDFIEGPSRNTNQTNNEQINIVFDQDADKFLGEFSFNGYKVQKAYLPGDGKQLRLYYTRFTPSSQPIGTVAIIHGFGEHSGRFLHIADFFTRKGFEVQLIDLRGFGYSGGARGCAVLSQLLMDVKVLLQQANPSIPLFLYGHSMGGLVVLTFSLLNPQIQISGVIATSPLIGLPADRQLDWFRLNFLQSAGKQLEDLVINSMVNPTALTKKNQHLRNAFGDRLMIPFLGQSLFINYYLNRLNMASSLIQGTAYLKKNASHFTTPVIILHGKLDSVTNYHDSIYFYEKCGSAEKGLKLFENGYHELQHDEECEELKSIVLDWVMRRMESAKPIGNKI